MSVYLDGSRAFTVDDIAHVRWDSAAGTVSVLDSSDTRSRSPAAPRCRPRPPSASPTTRVWRTCSRRPASSSRHRSSTSPRAWPGQRLVHAATRHRACVSRSTASASAGRPSPPGSYVMTPSYSAPNTIWGTKGSPNAEDWLEVDLGTARPLRRREALLLLQQGVRDRATAGAGGRGQHLPRAVALHGAGTTTAPGGSTSPGRSGVRRSRGRTTTTPPSPPVTARRLRVLMAPQPGYGIGVKELQVFDSGSRTERARHGRRHRAADTVAHPRARRRASGVHPGRGARVLGEHDRERDLHRR